MTEKVKITQEQADAIKGHTENWSESSLVIRHNNRTIFEGYESLYKLDVDTLIRALYIGYEIEPRYEMDDFVRYWKTDCVTAIGMITHIDYEKGLVQFDNTTFTKKIHDITGYATPEEIKAEKERRVWKSIGREVGEIYEGDIGVANSGQRILSKSEIEAAYKHDSLIGLYPNGSIISFVEEAEPNATTHN